MNPSGIKESSKFWLQHLLPTCGLKPKEANTSGLWESPNKCTFTARFLVNEEIRLLLLSAQSHLSCSATRPTRDESKRWQPPAKNQWGAGEEHKRPFNTLLTHGTRCHHFSELWTAARLFYNPNWLWNGVSRRTRAESLQMLFANAKHTRGRAETMEHQTLPEWAAKAAFTFSLGNGVNLWSGKC